MRGFSSQTRKSKRRRAALRSGGLCWYCGHSFVAFDEVTIDHVVPVSRGGGDEDENLVAACQGCNSMKANRNLSEFRMVMTCRERGIPVFTFYQIEWLRGQGFQPEMLSPPFYVFHFEKIASFETVGEETQ